MCLIHKFKTFEAVIPTDRTRIQVTIQEGSIRAYAPNHPGAIVVYLQEFEFSTDVIGDSRESCFRIKAMGLTLLAADDISNQEVNPPSSIRGVSRWIVSSTYGFTRLILIICRRPITLFWLK
jgi:autophagy-related protein 2